MDLANLISIIDSGADAITRDVVGNRTEEYRTAQQQAQAFKDAGYVGAAGPYVACWSTAKGWTDTQAANDILATALAWQSAQAQIRATRLSLKEQARAGADIDATLTAWLAFEKTLRAELGV